ncbi:uncharacterized protein V1518DRAFT_420099 [Limtongia smithiae]|uniref:uncharacterized protein n=1 Tax=Limtongia smithiae TaxID=1125753 RepID=UPI0034CFA15A
MRITLRRPALVVVVLALIAIASLIFLAPVPTLLAAPAPPALVPFAHAVPGLRPRVVVFGDSWSDDGTRPDAATASLASMAPRRAEADPDQFYPAAANSQIRLRKYGDGAGGRWSNGQVWPEYLCTLTTCSEQLNLAYGGAKVMSKYLPSPIPDLTAQYETYLAIREAQATAAAPTLDTDTDNKRTLFVFFFGINDIAQYARLLDTADQRTEAVEQSVDGIFSTAAQLAEKYPHSNFLFTTAIDVTLLPMWALRYEASDPVMAQYREAVKLVETWQHATAAHMRDWNQTLASAQLWDANKWFTRSVSGVAKNGFANVNRPCIDPVKHTVCAEPDKCVFWDSVHLTTAAHASIARRLSHLDLWASLSPSTPSTTKTRQLVDKPARRQTRKRIAHR